MTENRKRGSLRTSIMVFGVTVVVYVVVLGLLVRLAVEPSSTRLRQSSQAVLGEYRESAMRAGTMDATIFDLWRLLDIARSREIAVDTLEPLRLRVEKLAETSRTMNRLAASAGAASELRLKLAEVLVVEDRLRSEVLGAVASLQLGQVAIAEQMLRRADSLDAPLSGALNEATTLALQEMTSHEDALSKAIGAMNAVIWFWLFGGLLALAFLALFLRRRLHIPLERVDRALDRVSDGDLGVQLEHEHHDELGRLAQQFNRMTAMLRQRAVEDEARARGGSVFGTLLIFGGALAQHRRHAIELLREASELIVVLVLELNAEVTVAHTIKSSVDALERNMKPSPQEQGEECQ